jgi:hypothetical protein
MRILPLALKGIELCAGIPLINRSVNDRIDIHEVEPISGGFQWNPTA